MREKGIEVYMAQIWTQMVHTIVCFARKPPPVRWKPAYTGFSIDLLVILSLSNIPVILCWQLCIQNCYFIPEIRLVCVEKQVT